MILRTGITGFRKEITQQRQTTETDFFKKICYHVAHEIGGNVLDISLAETGRNFHYVVMQKRDSYFYILINDLYPYAAIATVVDIDGIQYVHNQEIEEVIRDYYRVLPKNELETILHVQQNNVLNEHELTTEEVEQILYWKPTTVGGVVFNYWD